MLLKLVSLYNRGRAVAPDRARPRSRPHPPIPPEVGAHYPPSILSEALRSGYMLQACGSTLSLAMTPALSFVMTQGQLVVRASAVLCGANPCAGPHSDNVESKVGEPIAEPTHPTTNTTPTLRLRQGKLYLRPLPRLPDELRPLLEQRFGPQHEIAMGVVPNALTSCA